MEYDPGDLLAEQEATRETLYEIGVLIATAAMVDFDLTCQILRIVSPKGGEPRLELTTLLAGMDFRVKLGLLRALSSQFKLAELEAVEKAADKLQEFYSRRNEVAHHFPVGNDGKRTFFQDLKVNTKTGRPSHPRPLSPAQIRRWSQQLEYWIIELDATLTAHGLPRPTGAAMSQEAQQAGSGSARRARSKPSKPDKRQL
jgi:hypothetical protein